VPNHVLTETPDQHQPQDLTAEQAEAFWKSEVTARAAKAAGTEILELEDQTPSSTADEPKKDESEAKSKKDDKPAVAEDAKSKKDDKPAATVAEDPVQKRFDTLELELKRTAGRVSAMQRTLDTAAKRATEQVSTAPTQTQQTAAMKDPEKWAALKKDFPEWGEAINDFLTANLPQGGLTADQVASQVEAKLAAEIAKRESRRVERKHPGWKDTVKSKDFLDWRAQQDEHVNELSYSDDADDAIDMLDLFVKSKAAKPEPTTTTTPTVQEGRSARLAAAAAPQRAGRSTPTPKDDSELTAKEIWQQEAARRAKLRAAQAA
jgi:hypothetical protein